MIAADRPFLQAIDSPSQLFGEAIDARLTADAGKSDATQSMPIQRRALAAAVALAAGDPGLRGHRFRSTRWTGDDHDRHEVILAEVSSK
ncbi:MAG: hypothetical protein U5L05_16015 [Rubrivivax sp.]|nr:hypothetical protein [Rubrivivax sp.]